MGRGQGRRREGEKMTGRQGDGRDQKREQP